MPIGAQVSPRGDDSDALATDTYDGERVALLRERIGVPALFAYSHATSTMDLAHAAGAGGAPAGTVFVADVQTAGRGRNGRRWVSDAEGGVWTTILERPTELDALGVLSLRVGLELSREFDALVGRQTMLKWPNDVLLKDRKLAGVLVEARWRDRAPEWVAVGVGVNRRAPADLPDAIGTGDAVRRSDILAAVVRAVRAAAAASGVLTPDELARFAARDAVRGREVAAPVVGRADGLTEGGELRVRAPDGQVHAVPTATVRYAERMEAAG